VGGLWGGVGLAGGRRWRLGGGRGQGIAWGSGKKVKEVIIDGEDGEGGR